MNNTEFPKRYPAIGLGETTYICVDKYYHKIPDANGAYVLTVDEGGDAYYQWLPNYILGRRNDV